MTLKEANKLRRGDEVYWTDPDDDLCSRAMVIKEIEISIDGDMDVACIIAYDGYELECPIEELS